MGSRRISLIEVVLIGVIAMLSLIILGSIVSGGPWIVPTVSIIALAVVIFVMMRYTFDPDHLRARQSDRTLRLAGQTLTYMRNGLNEESAQEVCKLLLPATAAVAVAITDREKVLGFSGADYDLHKAGSPIQTMATSATLEDGQIRVLTAPQEIGFPEGYHSLRAAIIVPLLLRDKPVGVLKFYYRTAGKIDETQQAMAEGLGNLLAMQLSLAELDAQTELATRMELKALQAQINPHFLFNTINTIASLIRTDPAQARILLREFAVFYRRTLEGSEDLITVEQEIAQTLRYLGFEIARFGRDRIILTTEIERGLESIMVPAFIIQPLVENAVGHAMRDDAPLHIDITVRSMGSDVVVSVADDGVGIPANQVPYTLEPDHGAGIGIALKNVDDRLKGYFGSGSGLKIESKLGVGTTVHLILGSTDSVGMENVC